MLVVTLVVLPCLCVTASPLYKFRSFLSLTLIITAFGFKEPLLNK
jgi:hypothetical protein